MGNHSTKESTPPARHTESAGPTSGPTSPTERLPSPMYAARSGRGSRPDLSMFGIGSSSHTDAHERRETKQEREARKLEKERTARLKERERSIKEEHVDGGYLVTMGVYTGIEDFNKGVVRQLMIERRIAPFWRGLNEYREDWTEYQLIAAGRGLSIPPADEIPQEHKHTPPGSEHVMNNNAQNLMVPVSSRSHSAASEASMTLSPPSTAFSLPSPLSPAPPSPIQAPSPFRPRSKTLASLTTTSKASTPNDIVPREINLPNDPLINGQAIEVFLYKDAEECPICFLSYPPYLNKTRCCDQPICSECFVQIKRPDPHPPEHHDPSNPAPALSQATSDPESLVSEPACCPYCQQQEFGVTYEPPAFRRGLSYAAPGIGNYSSAMSSTSSLNSASSPPMVPHTHKRRTTSISANASTVITTDRIRPDWATKLANARSHLARRSAAATALHTAAYLIGNGTADSRNFVFSGRGRFGRNRGESSPATSGAVTPSSNAVEGSARNLSEHLSTIRREGHDPGSSRRRSRIDDLEDMMMMEAIRLSLVAEEERKRKANKESSKDAKRKAKEERKQERREKRVVYGSEASSASGSALSLSLPTLGRRRGNSGGSGLGREITSQPPEPPSSKGKGVDRGLASVSGSSSSAPVDLSSISSRGHRGIPGARHLDTNNLTNLGDFGQPLPSPTAPEKSSHLRHMSTASSQASSFVESVPGSLRNDFHGSSSTPDSVNASGISIAAQVDGTPDGDPGGSVGAEPMFNFRSLAAMIGQVEDDKSDAAKHIEHLEDEKIPDLSRMVSQSGLISSQEMGAAALLTNRNNVNAHSDGPIAQQQLQTRQEAMPEVRIIPETPAAVGLGEDSSKQLGVKWDGGVQQQITQ